MNDKDKSHCNDLLDSIISLIVFLIFILSIIVIAYIFIKFSFLLIEDKNYSDYLGFIGSVIGGFITLGGVILTIKHEREIDNKRNKPILSFKKGYSEPCNTTLGNLDVVYIIDLPLENIGNSIAKDIEISFNDNDILNGKNFNCRFIEKNNSTVIKLKLNNIPNKYINLKFTITYYDLSGNKEKYESSLICFSDENEPNKYIACIPSEEITSNDNKETDKESFIKDFGQEILNCLIEQEKTKIKKPTEDEKEVSENNDDNK